MAVQNAFGEDTKHSAYGTAAYDAAGSAIMDFTPLSKIHQSLCAFHVPSHDRTAHVRSHHYCTHLRPDLHQCVVYDSDRPDARLLGVEYIVPEEVYAKFSPDEQKLYHSHKYEVESGMLVLGTKSGVPESATNLAEQPAMLELHKTYGKTIHTWPTASLGREYPIGCPELMMSYTADGQLPRDALDERDKSLGVSSSNKKAWRSGDGGYLPQYETHEAADSWEKGKAVQLKFEEVEMKMQ